MFKSIFSISILLFLKTSGVFAQTNSTILNHVIVSLAQQPPTEKVYLHLAKTNYTYGDTIWYKAYAVIGQRHQLSVLSGVLYVELYNANDSLVTRQILPLHSGISWSDIPLPANIKQGIYHIRAYTNWMRNFGNESFYNETIRIGGIATSQDVVVKTTAAANPDVQFFPEGGELVNGIRSKVAIKAVKHSGLGEDIKGSIVDDNGNVVADFTTQHLGMGVFAFTPQAGQSYKAIITGLGETSFTTQLPQARDKGYTLAVNNSAQDSIFIKVAVNDKTLTELKNSNFYILAQSGGKVYYTAEGKLDEFSFHAKVEKARFPTGIVQFTLFTQTGEPVAERIAYVESADTLQLQISSASENYSSRQPIKINLQALDGNNNSIIGSFSVSVIDDSKVGTNELTESTIVNNLLFSSDLKGYIEEPNYYFTNKSDQTRADLDILLLTQGYRRYKWQQILTNSQQITYQPEKALEVSGSITSGGKPVANGKISLTAPKENFISDTTTDILGNFKFSDLNFTDTTTIVLRARKKNDGANVGITVANKNFPQFSTINFPVIDTLSIPAYAVTMHKNYNEFVLKKKIDMDKQNRILQEVKVKSYLHKEPKVESSTNLNGASNADQVIMGDNLSGCITLSNCLTGRVMGVSFGSDGTPYNNRSHGAMVVIMDGIILDGNYLNNINADDISSIEVLRSGSYLAIYGSSAPAGALVITMKHGASSSLNIIPRGLITYNINGYYKVKTFYSPKYAIGSNSNEPDERSVIYWNPNIITDKDGKATVEYYNADTKGRYRLVLEGIDDNGNLGRQVFKYNVE